MNSTTYITLDLQAPNLAVVVSAKQEDTRGRRIAATLRDGSASFDATGLLCEIRYAKPDGTVGFYDTLEDDTTPAYTIDGNVVTFTLAEQMLTIAGAVYVDVNFYAPTGEKLTAFAFVLQVEASVLSDGTIVSSDYYNVLTATLAEAAEIAANLPIPSESTPIPDSSSGSAGTGNGFSRGNHSHPLNVATSGTPANLGTAANGTSANYARQDHVHAMPSAADVGALTGDDVHYKVYSSVEQLGLNVGSAVIADAFAAMSAAAILICPASDFAASETPASFAGSIQIVKCAANNTIIQAFGEADGAGDYRMFCDATTGSPTGAWIETPTSATTGNVTAIATITTTTDNFYLKRIGGVVYFMLRFTVNASTSDFGICTLPTGFRPSARVVTSAVRVWSRSGLSTQAETLAVLITSDGLVSANTASAGFSSSETSDFFIQTSFPI